MPRRHRDDPETRMEELRGQSAQQVYRGYRIILDALNNRMWIEKDRQLIAWVPDGKSWAWAREQVDALAATNPPRRRSNRRPSARSRLRHNPPLVTFGNPPRGEIMSKRVFEVAYKHATDGKAYKHEFAAGVCMEALPDGSIRIYSMRGKRLWGDF